MSLCVARRKNGTPCRRSPAKGEERCDFHIRKANASIVSGKHSKYKVPGVPRQYDGIYQDFVAQQKPFDLTADIAKLRTLYVECRDILDSRQPEKIRAACRVIRSQIDGMIERHPEQEAFVETLLNTIESKIKAELLDRFSVSTFSTDEIKDLTFLLNSIVKAAEAMKKIQDGVKLQVEIDTTMIVKILKECVYPAVPETERRQQIIARLRQISVSTPQRSLPEAEAIPAEFHVNEQPVLAVAGGAPSGTSHDMLPVDVNEWGDEDE